MTVKEEITEGLRFAVSKGEPLRTAMMSFYNAGYSKQDVEDSARAMQNPQMQVMQPMVQQSPQLQQPQTQPIQQPAQQQVQMQQPQAQFQQPGVVQRVSGYGEKTGIFSNTLIYILVFLLIFFGGVLLAVFLFRDELANLFNGIL